MDREGRLEALKMPVASYLYPRASPDGKRVAVETDDEKGADIWIADVSGATAARRLTFAGHNRDPVWMDGERVAFQSDRDGDPAIFWQRADGTGTPERLTTPEPGTAHLPQSWAPDGKHFLFTVRNGEEHAVDLLAAGEASGPWQWWRRIAGPDHRGVFTWRAMGRGLRWRGRRRNLCPAVSRVRRQVPNRPTGPDPFWSPDGTELFVGLRLGLRSVRINTRPTFAFGPPSMSRRPGSTAAAPGSNATWTSCPMESGSW